MRGAQDVSWISPVFPGFPLLALPNRAEELLYRGLRLPDMVGPRPYARGGMRVAAIRRARLVMGPPRDWGRDSEGVLSGPFSR